MNAQMQLGGGFTHAKCQCCKHLASIDKFEETRTNLQSAEGDNGSAWTAYIPKYKCPICGYADCEPLFPSEVN